MSASIAVYADWDGLAAPFRLGALFARRAGGREVFEFEFDAAAVARPEVRAVQLDPRLGFFEGPSIRRVAARPLVSSPTRAPTARAAS